MSSRGLSLSLCLAIALLGAVARAAPPSTKLVKTVRWKALLPSSWRLEETTLFGADAQPSRWLFASPKRNLIFEVRLQADGGTPFAKLAEEQLTRLHDRLQEPEIVKKEQPRLRDSELFYVVARGLMTRKKTLQGYLVFRLVARDKGQKEVVHLSLSSSGERLDAFVKIAEGLMGSFDLASPVVGKGGKR